MFSLLLKDLNFSLLSASINCNGIDYFLLKCPESFEVKDKEIHYLSSNTSDHYPIRVQITCGFQYKNNQKDVMKTICNKINMKRVDKDNYKRCVEKQLNERADSGCLDTLNSESKILNLTKILSDAAKRCSKSKNIKTKT